MFKYIYILVYLSFNMRVFLNVYEKIGFLAGYQASIPIKVATTYPIIQHNDMAMENGPFDDLPIKHLHVP